MDVLSAKILTISDAASRGEREDASGPALEKTLVDAGFAVLCREIVADGRDSVAGSLRALADGFAGLVVTTGGTGMSPRDLTPEATLDVVERLTPGLAESMRAINPLGRLSRGVAGIIGLTLIVNLPGSPQGAVECLDSIIDILPHALILLRGAADPHPD